MKCAIDGCGGKEPTRVALADGSDARFVIDVGAVYFSADGPIAKCGLGSDCFGYGLTVEARSAAHALAVDATSVYWADSDGTIMRLTPK